MRLILLRHAKAEDFSQQGDHGRRLSNKGRERARHVGELLAEHGIDRALVSTAARTRETFEQLGLNCEVEYLDELYNASGEGLHDLLAPLACEPRPPQTVLIVGHVPSVQVWAADFAIAAGDIPLAYEIGRWYPTAAFTAIDLPGATWDDILAGDFPQGPRILQLERG